MTVLTQSGRPVFVPSRTVPEPLHWESRENYAERIGLNLDQFDWIELVAATVIRNNGVVIL